MTGRSANRASAAYAQAAVSVSRSRCAASTMKYIDVIHVLERGRSGPRSRASSPSAVRRSPASAAAAARPAR
ncbi:hypothetical protein ACFQ0B_04565 [Nonomuraea thailandensis]